MQWHIKLYIFYLYTYYLGNTLLHKKKLSCFFYILVENKLLKTNFVNNKDSYALVVNKVSNQFSWIPFLKQNFAAFIYIIELTLKDYTRYQKPMLNYYLFTWYTNYINTCYTRFSLEWRFVDIANTLKINDAKKFWKYFVNHKLIYLVEKEGGIFFQWFLQLINLKDSKLLVFFLQRFFFKTPIKYHKRYFFMVSDFLRKIYFFTSATLNIKGFSVYFKGKLGKKGSVRKTKFFAKHQLYSGTNKKLRLNYRTFIIWTETGAIGANISMFF